MLTRIHNLTLPAVTQGTPQTVTLQRPLVPSKSPVNMPITMAPPGTVTTAVPTGGHVVANIAPAPTAGAVSKGLHTTTQAAGEMFINYTHLIAELICLHDRCGS